MTLGANVSVSLVVTPGFRTRGFLPEDNTRPQVTIDLLHRLWRFELFV